ncbi:hypothetical protein Nepgr_003604 [Nepenthes gracilis]|uniref:Uncharacterized protein n=1 Tax=Nepenthes gracilis TaxID=150966 RepID=A0AAD3RZU5_NEPGR|nr:hypothetical protein Nepgr_003604 [Nepenthes gracilis]
MMVGRTLDRGSSVMSKDFHPIHQILLLVGTNPRDMRLWKICPKEKLILQSFMVWDTSKCTLELTIALARDPTNPINRVSRSSDGSLFGITYSKHLVHTYTYIYGRDIQQHSVIDAHHSGKEKCHWLLVAIHKVCLPDEGNLISYHTVWSQLWCTAAAVLLLLVVAAGTS